MSTRKGEDISRVFSSRLKTLIGKESVSAFARKAGLKQASVDRYVKGIHAPNAEAIYTIATQFGVSSDWLLGLSDNPNGEDGNSDTWKQTALVARLKLDKVNEALGKIIDGTKALQEAVKGSPTPPPAASGTPSATDKNPPADQPPYEPLKPGTWRPQNW
ncbi:MAG: helix-turn-helix transcriptional regulator [Kiritimatiellae bacterium]|nr:helix-turn-helix transcriptional regulator [Kiritimatiellia bacterium]